MNINRQEGLSKILANITYNAGSLKPPQTDKLNIYLGIGLWSATNGLSSGLPVDVMQMLLAATVLRAQIQEDNPNQKPKVIVLLADSMAVTEGADARAVGAVTEIYRQSILRLLALLKLTDCSEILLSSHLERLEEYKMTRKSVEEAIECSQMTRQEVHNNYICSQTAITEYLHTRCRVGVKVGWVAKKSLENLKDLTASLVSWDELRFDRLHQILCPQSAIQCLYAKAGIKQQGTTKHNWQILEGCPYTAYPNDRRYIVQLARRVELSSIAKLKSRVVDQWEGMAEACIQLRDRGIVSKNILPVNCITTKNRVATVARLLNHWSNPIDDSMDVDSTEERSSHE